MKTLTVPVLGLRAGGHTLRVMMLENPQNPHLVTHPSIARLCPHVEEQRPKNVGFTLLFLLNMATKDGSEKTRQTVSLDLRKM